MTRPSWLPLLRSLASVLAVCAVALGASGCGDEDEGPRSEGSTTGAASASGGSAGVAPPVLLEVTSFALSLKITWETKSLCDSILGERKTATSDYADAFDVPGTDSVFVDPEATEDQTYTYRLRCKRGESLSAYSNEKTGNPMKF